MNSALGNGKTTSGRSVEVLMNASSSIIVYIFQISSTNVGVCTSERAQMILESWRAMRLLYLMILQVVEGMLKYEVHL